MRESPSPLASETVQVLLSREERSGEFIEVAPLSPRKLRDASGSYALGALGATPKRLD
jgi:hypothetical protein